MNVVCFLKQPPRLFEKLFAILLFCSQAEGRKEKRKIAVILTSPASLCLFNTTDDLKTVDPHLRLIILLCLHSTLHLSPRTDHLLPPRRPLFEGQIYSKMCVCVCSTILAKFPMRQPPAPQHGALNPPASTKAHINPTRPMQRSRPSLYRSLIAELCHSRVC